MRSQVLNVFGGFYHIILGSLLIHIQSFQIDCKFSQAGMGFGVSPAPRACLVQEASSLIALLSICRHAVPDQTLLHKYESTGKFQSISPHRISSFIFPLLIFKI